MVVLLLIIVHGGRPTSAAALHFSYYCYYGSARCRDTSLSASAASGSYNATIPSTSSALALVGKQACQILRIQGRVSLTFTLRLMSSPYRVLNILAGTLTVAHMARADCSSDLTVLSKWASLSLIDAAAA